jgi:hypothetical protein
MHRSTRVRYAGSGPPRPEHGDGTGTKLPLANPAIPLQLVTCASEGVATLSVNCGPLTGGKPEHRIDAMPTFAKDTPEGKWRISWPTTEYRPTGRT